MLLRVIFTSAGICLIVCCVLLGGAIGQQRALASKVIFVIDEKGTVAADITVAPNPAASGTSYGGLVILALPIALGKQAVITAAPDVTVSRLTQDRRDYTLLAVIAPMATSEIQIKVESAVQVTETSEGKAKLELDTRYRFMPDAERALLTLPIARSAFDVTVILPRKYDETAIVYRPTEMARLDERSFSLPADVLRRTGANSVWIVFPNPMARGLDVAKLVFSLLVGSFAVLFQIGAFRDRRLSWFVAIFLFSVVILIAAAYYTFVLAKGFDFLVFAAAALPNAVAGLGASIFLLIAKRRQARVTGYVTIDGAPAQIARITLLKVNGDERKEVRSTDGLKEGVYSFHIWQKAAREQYLVTASSSVTDEARGPVQEVTRGKQLQMPELKLTYRRLAQDATPTGRT